MVTGSQMSFLELNNVEKSYRSGPKQVTVLDAFNLRLEKGEFLAIMGCSGSGKTTLLNVIAGLDKVDSGSINLDGQDLTKIKDDAWVDIRQKKIGIVFQFNQLLPEFTALENVMLPGMLRALPKGPLASRARDLLARMGLDARTDHLPQQLSGGEKQRVAIARALINEPQLLLADEPTGSLDVESGAQVFELLMGLQREFGISCMMVTHNQRLAKMCDRIRSIDRAVGTPKNSGDQHV